MKIMVAAVLVPFEGMARSDVAPGQKDGSVLLVAGCVEYLAKVDRLAQELFDSLNERCICLLGGPHR